MSIIVVCMVKVACKCGTYMESVLRLTHTNKDASDILSELYVCYIRYVETVCRQNKVRVHSEFQESVV